MDDPSLMQAKFFIGELVHHSRADYRGVIYDVDATYKWTDEWYQEREVEGRPPKNEPWYRVLVDGGSMFTYVGQQQLTADLTGEPIEHSDMAKHFSHFSEGRYHSAKKAN